MSHNRISKGLITLLLAVIGISSGNVCAQFVSGLSITDYETLNWMYEAGLIDEDERNRWEELFLDSLHLVPDSLSDYDKGTLSESKPIVSLRYDMYHRADDNQPYRQLLSLHTPGGEGLFADIRLEKHANDDTHFRDRLIGWKNRDLSIELGGLDPCWVGGILLGRHSRLLSTSKDQPSVLYPLNSRFNGLLISAARGNASVAGMASFDRDTCFSTRVHGGRILYSHKKYAIEVAAVHGTIENDKTGAKSEHYAAGTTIGMKGRHALKGNISLAIDGDGDYAFSSMMQSPCRKHEVFFWRFEDRFINPFGAGHANTDTEPVTLPEIGFEYRSRYSGETGLQTSSSFPVGLSTLKAETEWWETGRTQKYRVKVSCDLRSGKFGKAVLFYLTGDDNLSEDYGRLDCVAIKLEHRLNSSCRGRLSSQVRRQIKNSGERITGWIEGHLEFEGLAHDTNILIRLYDPYFDRSRDQYAFCSLRETFDIFQNLKIQFIISSRFGPEQDSIEKARMQLRITASC